MSDIISWYQVFTATMDRLVLLVSQAWPSVCEEYINQQLFMASVFNFWATVLVLLSLSCIMGANLKRSESGWPKLFFFVGILLAVGSITLYIEGAKAKANSMAPTVELIVEPLFGERH